MRHLGEMSDHRLTGSWNNTHQNYTELNIKAKRNTVNIAVQDISVWVAEHFSSRWPNITEIIMFCNNYDICYFHVSSLQVTILVL